MPRGFTTAHGITLAMRRSGLFRDARSKGLWDTEHFLHFELHGEDMSHMREMVFKRDRGRCQECLIDLDYETAELDHIQGGTSGRCDCFHNLQILCHGCHTKKHGRVTKFQIVRRSDADNCEA